MPQWLRARLVDDLETRQKVQVLRVLRKLLVGERLDMRALRRCADLPPFSPSASMPYRDKILVEAIIEEQIGGWGPLELDQLMRPVAFKWGVNEILATLLTALYAVAMWSVTPKPNEGALAPGAWLPLATIILLGLIILPIASRVLRRVDVELMVQRWTRRGSATAARGAVNVPMLSETDSRAASTEVESSRSKVVVDIARSLRGRRVAGGSAVTNLMSKSRILSRVFGIFLRDGQRKK